MIIEKKNDNSAIVIAPDRLDTINSADLNNVLSDLHKEGFSRIAIDFSSVVSIDSSALGKLLVLNKKFKEMQGELCIINVTSSNIKKMFQLIHLDKVIAFEEKS